MTSLGIIGNYSAKVVAHHG